MEVGADHIIEVCLVWYSRIKVRSKVGFKSIA